MPKIEINPDIINSTQALSSAFSDIAKKCSTFTFDMTSVFESILSNYQINAVQIRTESLNAISVAVSELQKSFSELKSQLSEQIEIVSPEAMSFENIHDNIIDVIDNSSDIIDDETASTIKEHLSSQLNLSTIISILAFLLSIIGLVADHVSADRETKDRYETSQQSAYFHQTQIDLLQDIYEVIVTVDNQGS